MHEVGKTQNGSASADDLTLRAKYCRSSTDDDATTDPFATSRDIAAASVRGDDD
jgi:hypothetical protein